MVGQWELRAIEQAVERGRAGGVTGDGAVLLRPGRALHRGHDTAPRSYKLPAPKRFVPLHGQPVTAIMPTFLHVQSMFQLQMQRAAGLDLIRVKVADPDLTIPATEPGRHVRAGDRPRTAASRAGPAGARQAEPASLANDHRSGPDPDARREEARGKHAVPQVMKSHSDRILRRIAQEIEDQIDCTACANCCRVATVRLSERDVERLARHLRIPPARFLAEYTVESATEGRILRRSRSRLRVPKRQRMHHLRGAPGYLPAVPPPGARPGLDREPDVGICRSRLLLPDRLQLPRGVQRRSWVSSANADGR